MPHCPTCESYVNEDHPVVFGEAIEKMYNWDDFESDRDGWGKPVGSVIVVLDQALTLVAKKIQPNTGDLEYAWRSGDEYPQGSEWETYLVFQLGDRFLKKTGLADSYGEIQWNGPMKEVQGKTKTITVWED